jgi:hypothetical protein
MKELSTTRKRPLACYSFIIVIGLFISVAASTQWGFEGKITGGDRTFTRVLTRIAYGAPSQFSQKGSEQCQGPMMPRFKSADRIMKADKELGYLKGPLHVDLES